MSCGRCPVGYIHMHRGRQSSNVVTHGICTCCPLYVVRGSLPTGQVHWICHLMSTGRAEGKCPVGYIHMYRGRQSSNVVTHGICTCCPRDVPTGHNTHMTPTACDECCPRDMYPMYAVHWIHIVLHCACSVHVHCMLPEGPFPLHDPTAHDTHGI